MKEALFYKRHEEYTDCFLCPHNCRLKADQTGICRVRKNVSGKLVSENYGKVCSLHSDPIEKKPLYHFFPGRKILSVGSIGCNLRCKFCQNWEISQTGMDDFPSLRTTGSDDIIALAQKGPDNIGVAYTYNEPTVWIEFMLEIAAKIKGLNMKNVMVTNGFINPEPLKELIPYMDAFSVDLKAFTDKFYKNLTSSRLDPVLDALRMIRESDKHLEISNLLITNHNDDPGEFSRMIGWIAGELGEETVLHISRYFPTYKLHEDSTSEHKLMSFFDLARQKLHHVYLGNVRTGKGQNTFCPRCKTLVIIRSGYSTAISGLDHEGRCLNCQTGVISRENMHLS